LLLNLSKKGYGSYGFRFKGETQNKIAGIHSIGWEEQTSTAYSWHGLQRSEVGKYVFQYTLTGLGQIQIDGKDYPLESGQAFLVEIPSNHCYYFPKSSKRWEFIHITLYGKEVRDCFHFVNKRLGPIVQFHPESALIKLLIHHFQEASTKKIADAYQASAMGYAFIMELYRSTLNIDKPPEQWPEQITKAVLYVQNHYFNEMTLDDIVNASGISKYHFTRLFHRTTNMTPIQYLTKIRIDKAVELLRMSNLTVEEISRNVGYSNGNYFNKVFRQIVGTSPGQFRKSKYTVPVDHLITD
jgi:AraC-like DNA-binding protein